MGKLRGYMLDKVSNKKGMIKVTESTQVPSKLNKRKPYARQNK